MNAPHSLSSTVVGAGARVTRWPGIVGVIGMVVGAIMALGELQELVRILTWTEEDWQALLGPLWTESIVAALPSTPWRVASSIVEIGLGCLLLVASWWLFRRDRRAVGACRTWAWLAIGYAAVVIVWVATWLPRYLDGLPGDEQAGAGAVYFGMAVAMGIMLAFPVFLLYWLSREDVRTDYEAW